MAADKQNLQDAFLNHVRKAKVPVTIFLINGVKLQGVITWFDNFCVLLRRDGQVNDLLSAVGIAPVDWLGDPRWSMPAIVLFAVWKNFGYNMATVQFVHRTLALVVLAGAWLLAWRVFASPVASSESRVAAGTLAAVTLGQVALVAANVSLFVASPLIAPLAMLGWGAALGGVVGAVVGAEKSDDRTDGKFSDLVLDAIRSGHVVLIVHTLSGEETSLVREIIGDSVLLRN